MSINHEIIFVLSDVRSGSTLLDQVLGAHPSVLSLGELHWLAAYVLEDRTIYDPKQPLICTCGKVVRDCGFWRQVATSLGQPLDTLRLRPRFFYWRGRERDGGVISQKLRHIPRRLLGAFPESFRHPHVQQIFGGARLAHDSFALFNAIFDVSGSRYLVDSSKDPFRFRALYNMNPSQVRVIQLVRDYRAVVYSKMKRGISLEAAALGWRRKMMEIDALTADLPASHKCDLKYEALCNDPEGELTRVCSFLGLDFSPAMLQRPTRDIHHIGGSPSKFDSSRAAISLDTAYQEAFEPNTLGKLRDLVQDVARVWGY